jgi:hypothetical protein
MQQGRRSDGLTTWIRFRRLNQEPPYRGLFLNGKIAGGLERRSLGAITPEPRGACAAGRRTFERTTMSIIGRGIGGNTGGCPVQQTFFGSLITFAMTAACTAAGGFS